LKEISLTPDKLVAAKCFVNKIIRKNIRYVIEGKKEISKHIPKYLF